VEDIFQKYKLAFSYCVSFIIILIFGWIQVLVQDEAFAISNNEPLQDWDKLLREEMPSVRESVDTIQYSVIEGNYSLVKQQIENIESGGNWYSIRKELEARDATDLVSQFNASLAESDKMAKTEDSVAMPKKAQLLSDELDGFISRLGEPIVDDHRLI
jgi:hypothetical protein